MTITLPIIAKNEYMPEYANASDACMDLKIKLEDALLKELLPGESIIVGTGVQVAVPEDHIMLVFPRSSTGFKLNVMLANTTGIIDSGFRDEIKLKLHNFGKQSVLLADKQRIAQFFIIPRPKIVLNRVEDSSSFRQGDRGGGFGSTGV